MEPRRDESQNLDVNYLTEKGASAVPVLLKDT